MSATAATTIELTAAVIQSNQFWNQLFQVINTCYEIAYVSHNGKNYFNCSNTWYSASRALKYMQENNIVPAHADKGQSPKKVNANEITYEFMGKFDIERIMFDCVDEFMAAELGGEEETGIHSIIQMLSELKCKPEEITFVAPTNIIIKNDCGINDDRRGADKTHIALPFKSRVNLNKQFTLKDVLVANSQLKSHKFDYNYEMYCSAECEYTPNAVIVDINMDHGS